jgi:hypothetical protein
MDGLSFHPQHGIIGPEKGVAPGPRHCVAVGQWMAAAHPPHVNRSGIERLEGQTSGHTPRCEEGRESQRLRGSHQARLHPEIKRKSFCPPSRVGCVASRSGWLASDLGNPLRCQKPNTEQWRESRMPKKNSSPKACGAENLAGVTPQILGCDLSATDTQNAQYDRGERILRESERPSWRVVETGPARHWLRKKKASRHAVDWPCRLENA